MTAEEYNKLGMLFRQRADKAFDDANTAKAPELIHANTTRAMILSDLACIAFDMGIAKLKGELK